MFAEEHSLVTDFGVAKAVSAAAASPNITGGMALGTPTYMAPEQAAADPATDHRADIYALGAMAYEMLAGRPVFTAPTPQGVLAAHVVETPVPVAEHRPSVPPALADLVMRCLEKKPADRWQTADEMLPHLEAMLTPSGPVTPAGGLGPFRVLRRGGRWLARRPAAVGGAAALLVAVVVALRLFGGWPVPSLVASGVLDRREPIVLADFQNRSADSSLGATVTELFRVGFSRSRSVRLMDPSRIADALGRMRRPPGTPLDVALAREVAQREGVKAAVAGEVLSVGRGFVVSARLVAAATGEVLAAVQATAGSADGLIAAVETVSGDLRRRIGESLLGVKGGEPLDQVTTPSLDALRRYSQALRAEGNGDLALAANLLREAVAIDSTFAMAWRKLGIILSQTGTSQTETVDCFTRAYRFRDRLPDRERYLASASYFLSARGDPERAAMDLRALLDQYPYDFIAINNLAAAYLSLGRWAQAESVAVRGVQLVPSSGTLRANLASALASQGKMADAHAVLARAVREMPSWPNGIVYLAAVEYSSGRPDSARARMEAMLADGGVDPTYRITAASVLVSLALVGGRLRDAEGYLRRVVQMAEQHRTPAAALGAQASFSVAEFLARGDTLATRRRIASALAAYPLASMAPADRPLLLLADAYALMGDARSARASLEAFRALPDSLVIKSGSVPAIVSGDVLVAEGRTREAIAELQRAASLPGCTGLCGLVSLGMAFDRSGSADSAIAVYERFVTMSTLDRLAEDGVSLSTVYRRLSALYEARGDGAKSREYAMKLSLIWAGADAQLQAIVDVEKNRARRLRE
jgi:tetratricopeptide (TPR) repeat protein